MPRLKSVEFGLWLVSVQERQRVPHHFVSCASLRDGARVQSPPSLQLVAVSCGLTLSHWPRLMLRQLKGKELSAS